VGPVAAAVVLLVVTAPLLYLNLYFFLLSRESWEGAARRVGVLASSCGIETGSCKIVARTGWARLVFGIPNTVFGLVWAGLLVWLAVSWLVFGVVAVPWWALGCATATVAGAVVLVWALLVKLEQPCPL